jgi:hypothetical protein
MQPREVVSGSGVAGICCPSRASNIFKSTNPPIRFRPCGAGRFAFSEVSLSNAAFGSHEYGPATVGSICKIPLEAREICLSLPFSEPFSDPFRRG